MQLFHEDNLILSVHFEAVTLCFLFMLKFFNEMNVIIVFNVLYFSFVYPPVKHFKLLCMNGAIQINLLCLINLLSTASLTNS